MAGKHVDVTIRMPEAWVDVFWGWYLDGGGEYAFSESRQFAAEEAGTHNGDAAVYKKYDKQQLLIVHSDEPIGNLKRNEGTAG